MITIFHLTDKGPLQAVDNMTFVAPMICPIARAVFHHTHPQSIKLHGFPKRFTGGAGMALPWQTVPGKQLKIYRLHPAKIMQGTEPDL